MTVYAQPGQDGSLVTFKSRYENFIGGQWVPPVKGNYFENPSQDKTSNGKQIEQIIAHNYFVFYSCIESTHRPSSNTTVGERSNNSKFSYVSPRSI